MTLREDKIGKEDQKRSEVSSELAKFDFLASGKERLEPVIHITLADESDVDQILSIIKETAYWLHEKGIKQWNPKSYLKKYDKEYFLDCITNKEVYVIKSGAQVIGVFAVKWNDKDIWNDSSNDAGYIHHLTVRRGIEGKGLGKTAIEWVKDMLRSSGKKYLRLDCRASNNNLNEYYKRCGFEFKGYFELGKYKGNKYELEV